MTGTVTDDAIDKVVMAPACRPLVMPTWCGGLNSFSPEILAEYDARHPLPLARASGSAIDIQAREIKQLSWHLLRRSVDPHLALELVIAFNAHRGMPPLEQHEVEALVAAVANHQSEGRFPMRPEHKAALDNLAALNRQPAKQQRQLRAFHVGDLLTMDIPPREMMLAEILPTKGIVEVYSRRGVGKTHMSLGIGYAVASGGKFLLWTAPKPRRVLLLDGEMPLVTLQERLASIVAAAGEQPPSADYLTLLAADYQPDGMPDLATPEGQAEIEPFLDGIELVILDNLSTLCRTGKENDSEGWVSVQEWLLALRRRGISSLFVHHAGKGGNQRGTSKREDVLDTVVVLKHPEDYVPTEGARFEVHLEKARGIVGDGAKPFEAKLEVRNGAAIWTTRDLEDVTLWKAADLFKDGLSVRDVATDLNISKSAAQRLRAKAVERGLIDG